MEAATPEKLLEAFRVLDPENRGYLKKDDISKMMMDEGEPFTQVSVFDHGIFAHSLNNLSLLCV